MSTKSLQPLKGFKDRYPEDTALDQYLFETVRSVGALYGFEEYDGPLVEPIELYEGKTAREILEKQAFIFPDRKGNTLMLRPEMTPSLARMVAARSQELTLPVRWCNIGKRYRYEAPQKGRDREFYQMDFDILGSESPLADIEILAVAVELFKRFGATPKDFVVYINSRAIMNELLQEAGIPEDLAKEVIFVIDRRDKVTPEVFIEMLLKAGLTETQIEAVEQLLTAPGAYAERFSEILTLAKQYGIEEYIEVNPIIVRGFDYYTGLVFEVKSRGELGRSLLGGGRYDNLVGMFGTQDRIPGVGFATSDAILKEFLDEAGLLPTNLNTSATVLVTVFSEDQQGLSTDVARQLRDVGIATELYPDLAKLPKQLKYADRKAIPYVVVIGPDEAEKGLVVLKNMTEQSQETLELSDVISRLSSTS